MMPSAASHAAVPPPRQRAHHIVVLDTHGQPMSTLVVPRSDPADVLAFMSALIATLRQEPYGPPCGMAVSAAQLGRLETRAFSADEVAS